MDALQRLTPELAIVNADLSTAHIYLNLAVITERTRSEANKTRIVDVMNGKGVDFLAALQRYRFGTDVIVSDDQKLLAIQNFFFFGQKVCQFAYLWSNAINAMIVDYLHLPSITYLLKS